VRISEIALEKPVVAFAGEPLRMVVQRMAESGVTRLPVVESRNVRRLVGMISLSDLLRARAQNLEEERARDTVLRIRFPFLRHPKSGDDSSTSKPPASANGATGEARAGEARRRAAS
jgi:CBS domain-containing protein